MCYRKLANNMNYILYHKCDVEKLRVFNIESPKQGIHTERNF